MIKTLLILSLFFISSQGNASNRILMMVAEGFYAPEYYKPLETFKNAGFVVTTATKYAGKTYPDRRQINQYPAVESEILFSEVDPDHFDAIVFAGGNGAWEDFFPNNDVHKVVTAFINSDKITALLCSATGLLGVVNNFNGRGTPIAEGRRVTGYKRVELLLHLGKTRFSRGVPGKPYVVVDGNLITGRDPISAQLFAETVVKSVLKQKGPGKNI